jgi:hypothetical protein
VRKKLAVVGAVVALAFTGLAGATPASAATVNNMYECAPATGWCFQTNPPYNPAFARACRWNSNYNFTGGMWYTGCTPGYWRPQV